MFVYQDVSRVNDGYDANFDKCVSTTSGFDDLFSIGDGGACPEPDDHAEHLKPFGDKCPRVCLLVSTVVVTSMLVTAKDKNGDVSSLPNNYATQQKSFGIWTPSGTGGKTFPPFPYTVTQVGKVKTVWTFNPIILHCSASDVADQKKGKPAWAPGQAAKWPGGLIPTPLMGYYDAWDENGKPVTSGKEMAVVANVAPSGQRGGTAILRNPMAIATPGLRDPTLWLREFLGDDRTV